MLSHRELGKSGLKVSSIGLGCMGMSEFYGPTDEMESIRVIDHAIGIGVNFFDTADMYGRGHNEELLARALRGRRDEVVLATKFGVIRTDDPMARGISGHPDYVRKACDASLRRLRMDHIDLYYLHRVDDGVPIEETVGAMKDLVQAGKVRFLGLSEAAGETIRKAQAVHPIAALQSEYSLFTRDLESKGASGKAKSVLETIRELGIGLVAYSPLGRGFLTGKYRSTDDFTAGDYRHNTPRFQGENFEKNLTLVERLEGMAKDKRVTAAQLALAWLLAQGPDVVPIPGTKKISRLDENAGADAVRLTASEVEALSRAISGPAGDRYPARMMGYVQR